MQKHHIFGGFIFKGTTSLFLGQAESPAAAGAARLAHTDCYLWELLATQPVWRRSSSTVIPAAGVFGLCTHAGVQPSPCTAHFCLCSHPQRGLGDQLGCSHAGTTTAKASCRNWVLSKLCKSVASVLALAEPEMHLLCVEAVLVKWLLCNEYLLLLLNNHKNQPSLDISEIFKLG